MDGLPSALVEKMRQIQKNKEKERERNREEEKERRRNQFMFQLETLIKVSLFLACHLFR